MVNLNEQAVGYTNRRFQAVRPQTATFATYYVYNYTQTDTTKHINPAAHMCTRYLEQQQQKSNSTLLIMCIALLTVVYT